MADLRRLTSEHQEALEWFAERAGQEVRWPPPLSSGLHLVNRAKGVHKPQGWRYALSVRETLSAQYDDKEPEHRPDGSWRYPYHQEGNDPAQRDREYTNQALVACMDDNVPVGVLRQTQGKPGVRYRILGLAYVKDWTDGWFILESIPAHAPPESTPSLPAIEADGQPFSPESITDSRQRTLTSIAQRRGQAAFRKALIEAYEGRCAITGCNILDVLEAAHIHPYRGDETNQTRNGILLRADVHTMFDLGLIAIEPDSLTVRISPEVESSGEYAELDGIRILEPKSTITAPAAELLRWHWDHVRSW